METRFIYNLNDFVYTCNRCFETFSIFDPNVTPKDLEEHVKKEHPDTTAITIAYGGLEKWKTLQQKA